MEMGIPLPLPQNSFKFKRRLYEHAKNQPLLAKRKFVPGSCFIGHTDLVQRHHAFLSVSFMASFAPADVP
jgi:hypothetical protein